MRILVTGITGFAGGHLAEALLAQSQGELFGLSRHGDWPAEWRHLNDRVVLRSCDLGAPASIQSLLSEIQPERIYHLAGYAQVARSFQEVEAAWAGNLTATRNLYEAVEKWGGQPRILYVSSGQIYGVPQTPDQVFDEQCLLRPISPYAASKSAADLASYQYTQSAGLYIVGARPLNHIGPRQSPQYAVANFASQLAAIELGKRPAVVETGNLSPCRDLTDVRDVVQAYIRLLDQGRSGEAYNIGSGAVYSIQSVLDLLLSMTKKPVEVRPRVERMRPGEATALRVDAGKLRQETGWTPQFTLEQTLRDTLEYWRSYWAHSD